MSADMLNVVRGDMGRALARGDGEAYCYLHRLYSYLLARCEREGYLS